MTLCRVFWHRCEAFDSGFAQVDDRIRRDHDGLMLALVLIKLERGRSLAIFGENLASGNDRRVNDDPVFVDTERIVPSVRRFCSVGFRVFFNLNNLDDHDFDGFGWVVLVFVHVVGASMRQWKNYIINSYLLANIRL